MRSISCYVFLVDKVRITAKRQAREKERVRRKVFQAKVGVVCIGLSSVCVCMRAIARVFWLDALKFVRFVTRRASNDICVVCIRINDGKRSVVEKKNWLVLSSIPRGALLPQRLLTMQIFLILDDVIGGGVSDDDAAVLF